MSQAHAHSTDQSISPEIFRAYDIRGVFGDTLSEDVAFQVGQAFATTIIRETGKAQPTIVTARDGRESSPVLSAALVQGLKAAGASVKDIGLGPSPLCYFGTYYLEADAGIMLTGSHNPPTHNGFKMICANRPFFGEDIQEMRKLIDAGDVITAEGSVEERDLKPQYLDTLVKAFNTDGAKDVTAVWDPGNGAAGALTESLIARLPGKHIAINTEIDGSFPNHHPDPTVPENLEQLIGEVKKHNADIGIAFDGDGDRIGCVDAKGVILWGDQMLALFAREILSRKPGATVIADVKASQTLFDDVAKHGGNPIMWKTGHSFIKSKMKEVKAEIAGEMSGHIFFADGYYGFDDGLYAAMRMLDIIAHNDASLEDMRLSIPAVLNTPEIRVECSEARKFIVVEEVRERLLDAAKTSDIKINEVDGVRVTYKDGWWLMRASNTQSALIVRCEAQHQSTLDELKAMAAEQLTASGLDVDLDNPGSAH